MEWVRIARTMRLYAQMEGTAMRFGLEWVAMTQCYTVSPHCAP